MEAHQKAEAALDAPRDQRLEHAIASVFGPAGIFGNREEAPDYETADGRTEILARMRIACQAFYMMATRTGCHAFIEFAGILSAFIQMCGDMETNGDAQWVHATVHCGRRPTMPDYVLAYLNEKLECIFGMKMSPTP